MHEYLKVQYVVALDSFKSWFFIWLYNPIFISCRIRLTTKYRRELEKVRTLNSIEFKKVRTLNERKVWWKLKKVRRELKKVRRIFKKVRTQNHRKIWWELKKFRSINEEFTSKI